MLLAGVDVSGSKSVGNHKFMGIVIGTQESICCIDKNLESKQIHMNALTDKKKQDAILSKLRFNGNENIAFCIRLDKDTIVKKISARKKLGHRYPKKISSARMTTYCANTCMKELQYFLPSTIMLCLTLHFNAIAIVAFYKGQWFSS